MDEHEATASLDFQEGAQRSGPCLSRRRTPTPGSGSRGGRRTASDASTRFDRSPSWSSRSGWPPIADESRLIRDDQSEPVLANVIGEAGRDQGRDAAVLEARRRLSNDMPANEFHARRLIGQALELLDRDWPRIRDAGCGVHHFGKVGLGNRRARSYSGGTVRWSMCRCLSFQPPSSCRKTMVTRV